MGKNKKRICLFAGFDKNGEIADYVIYYLKALSKIADVYYWGDFEASNKEKAKIEPYCQAVYCARHGKYDFGSWQELIQKIGREKIESYDEMILANDSCYGPLVDLSEIFQEMDQKKCDFWGLSSAYKNHIHLQSYFIVLKQPVLKSDVIYNFFNSVKPEANYSSVCAKYEDRFTYILSKAGFHFCSYIKYSETDNHPYRDIMSAISNRHFPFLKVKFFLGDIRDQSGVDDWRKIITKKTDYPVEIIEKDLTRRGFNLSEIDQKVQKKRSETPDFYRENHSIGWFIRKIVKVLARPIIILLDYYVKNRTTQYYYKIDRMNRSHQQLQQKYDDLRAQLDPDFSPRSFHLESINEKESNLKLDNKDAVIMRHFDLELPLTDESDVLIIGNIGEHNLASLELYDPTAIFLNNDWATDLGINSFMAKDLCNFYFLDNHGKKVYFDFILSQPLKEDSSAEDIQKYIANLKEMMIFESVLVIFVPEKETTKYEHILQDEDMRPAGSERGLVVRGDPFQAYCDKIGSIKGYKVLIYKRK